MSMTNYDLNRHCYFYIIFECGIKGYILKKEYLPKRNRKEQIEPFFVFVDEMAEKLDKYSEQELLDEIGYVSLYYIKSHKEIIKNYTENLCNIVSSSSDKKDKNMIYLIMSYKEIDDFSQIPRHDASRKQVFLHELKDFDGESVSVEIYLN